MAKKQNLRLALAEKQFHRFTQVDVGQNRRVGKTRLRCPKPLAREILTSTLLPIKTFSLSRPSLASRSLRKSLGAVLNSRRTRYVSSKNFSLAQLSSYLFELLGSRKKSPLFNGLDYRRKNYPSAGGLFESRIFLIVHRVDGLPAGLYFFDDEKAQLNLLKNINQLPLELVVQPHLATARKIPPAGPQVQILIAADIRRLQWAYNGLSYRLALNNATILMHQGLLIAEAMTFASVPLGAYPSDLFCRAAGLNWRHFPLMTQFCLLGCI